MTKELRNCRETLLVDNADLSESRFSDTRLEKSCFRDVNMRGVEFSDVDLSHASIENANLRGMKIEGVLVSDLMAAYRSSASKAPKPGIVLFAKDLPRLAKFYQTIASMSVVHTAPDHTILDSAHFQLILHAVPPALGDRIEITDPPQVRTNSPVKLCLPIASILEARHSARAFGGMLNPSEQEWIERGIAICDGYDPEGNVIQVRWNAA